MCESTRRAALQLAAPAAASVVVTTDPELPTPLFGYTVAAQSSASGQDTADVALGSVAGACVLTS